MAIGFIDLETAYTVKKIPMKIKSNKNRFINNITLITMRMRGHSGHSGYDRLADYMAANQIALPQSLSFTDRLISRCFKNLIGRVGSTWYHRANFLCEIKAARQWPLNNRRIFHFIYGENSYQYLGKLKKIRTGNRIVCTYHTPPEKFQTIVKNLDPLHEIDAIIVLSNFQKEFFINLLGHNNVWYVPHGIDVDFFKPTAKTQSGDNLLNCLFVGSHLRDVETFRQVVDILEHKDKTIRFHILSNSTNTTQFEKSTNVKLYSKIPERELLKLYQSTDLLTLPLIDSTANNSILEALACGLPIVTTDLPGTRDYLSDDCALFVPPGDAAGMVHAIEKLKDHRYRQHLSEKSRQQAQRFDWKIITDSLMDCYRKVMYN